ncbi:MAG: hypothetical protein AABX96_03425 [Nanoarchaeota archaeon]
MITRKDFESGKLSPIDAEAYMIGLRSNGHYGKAPEIDGDLARKNYPILFCGKIEDISYREPVRGENPKKHGHEDKPHKDDLFGRAGWKD